MDKGNVNHWYRKLNNTLLSDNYFVEQVKLLAKFFENKNLSCIQQWELFKFKVREMAMRRGEELKKNKLKKITEITEELNTLIKKIKKNSLSEDANTKTYKLSLEMDNLYTELAEGAYVRSRAKWFEGFFFLWKEEIMQEMQSHL